MLLVWWGPYEQEKLTNNLHRADISEDTQRKALLMFTTPLPPPPPAPTPVPTAGPDSALLDAARALEATFLAEMLKATGLGSMQGDFGGGIGEDQFQSFLTDAQAREMVENGGIGLAEAIFAAMTRRMND
ncbi:MAG: rod-binding protein [Paracoccaceae bacterium]